MSLIKRMRRQDAIYWRQIGVDSYGARLYDPPMGIRVRWDEKSSQYVNKDGEQVASRSTVYVPFDMKAGDMLLKGLFVGDSSSSSSSDVPTIEDPKEAGAWEVMHFANIPNIRAKEFLRICYT